MSYDYAPQNREQQTIDGEYGSPIFAGQKMIMSLLANTLHERRSTGNLLFGST